MRRGRFTSALVLALLLAAACAAAALPPSAAAHAALESSDPAADASVPESPRRIVLTFSEAPDAGLSLVRVVDAQGRAVPDVSKPQSVKGDKESLEVTPRTPLTAGVYTVNWRAVSSVDGHVQSGALAFGVGEQPAPGSAVVVELVHSSPWAGALAVAGRWLLYAGLVVLIGAAATSLVVNHGGLPRGAVTIARIAVAVAIAGLIGMVWAQKTLVGAPSLLPLFVMRQGQLLLGVGLALALCAGAVVLIDLWPARWSLWVLGLAGAAAVMAHVLAGHAASPMSITALNVAAQWVHMTAVGVWIGGLFWLLLGLRGRDSGERAAAVGAFTRLATVVLVVVIATGLLRAIVEVGSPGALVDTRYGVTFLVKVALAAGLIGLGALNHFFWAPAVRAAGGAPADAAADVTPSGAAARDGAASRRFALNSRGELAVALAVLAVTAFLSGVAPGRVADPASSVATPSQQVTASGSDYATAVRLELTLTPGVAGRNDYACAVKGYDSGETLPDVTAVSLRCSMPERPSAAPVTVTLERTADGRWTGGGLDFSVAGRWQVDVYIQAKTGGTTVPLELTLPAAP